MPSGLDLMTDRVISTVNQQFQFAGQIPTERWNNWFVPFSIETITVKESCLSDVWPLYKVDIDGSK